MKAFIRKIFILLFLILVFGSTAYVIYNRENAAHSANDVSSLHLARYFEPSANGMVQCFLCPNRCVLGNGQFGTCKARKNIDGKLYSMVYGKIGAVHVDPIEKKPFFHVLPGSKAYSIATAGCNMRCLFCQNWELSQAFPDQIPYQTMTPEIVVRNALASGSKSIAFTYNEPVINYEFVLETAKLAKAAKLKTVVVSSGYIEPEPLKELLQYIDAYKVDLKAFHEKFYRELTGGHLDDVLETMKIIKQSGVWLEVLTLLVPGQNDSDAEIRRLAKWIKENLGDDVPLHFSRFFPQFKLTNLPPTPVKTVLHAREIAMDEGLKYVYTGNVADPEGEITYCPKSREKVIERIGNSVISNQLKNGTCRDGEKIPGIWES